MKNIALAVSLLLFFSGCNKHPQKDDWYEEIETRQRIKVHDVGDGKTMMNFLKGQEGRVETEADITFTFVSLKSDSSEIIKSTCVEIFDGKLVGSDKKDKLIFRMDYRLYTLSDFEKNFVLIKNN